MSEHTAQELFVEQLEHLRAAAGSPLQAELVRLDGGKGLKKSSLSDLLKGQFTKAPPWERIEAYVNACVAAATARDIVLSPDSARRQLRNAHSHLTRFLEHAARNSAIPAVQAECTTPSNPMASAVPLQLLAAPAGFVGRVDQLDELDRALTTPEGSLHDGNPDGVATAVVSAIGGTGGIGKTWLALAWAHRNLHHFPDGQLSADLRGFSSGEPRHATDVLADFLAALGVDRDRQPQELEARVALYRTCTTGKRMLVLLDNAAATEQVEPLLPGGGTCTVLITSRNRLRGLVARHGACPVHIDVLTDVEARTLLADALDGAHANVTNEAEQAITELIRLCGGLPLALGLIAARIRADPGLLNDIVNDLRNLGLDALDSDDPTASLPTVLSWSLRHLKDEHRTMFGLLGIAPGPDITLPAAASLTSAAMDSAHKVLSSLEEASLLERRPGGRFVMHDLIRAFASDTAQRDLAKCARNAALRRIVDFYLQTTYVAERILNPERPVIKIQSPIANSHIPKVADIAWATSWFVVEYSCLLAAQKTALTFGWHGSAWDFAWSLGSFQARHGHSYDRLAVCLVALTAAQHIDNDIIKIRTHHLVGHAYVGTSQHDSAIDHLYQAIDLAKQENEELELARAHHAAAWAWEKQGDYCRALKHTAHSMKLFRKLDDPAGHARTLNQAGWYQAQLGDYERAMDFCNAALTVSQYRNYSSDASALDSIGYIYHQIMNFQESINHYTEALALFRSRNHSYSAAETLERIGHPHSALGQRHHARAAWNEALGLYREQGRDTDAERVQRHLDRLDAPGNPRSGLPPNVSET